MSALPIINIAEILIKNVRHKPVYLKVFTDWSRIVGEHIASISTPYRVTDAGNSRTLVLKALKGHALEIQHESFKILIKINDFLQEKNYFSKLKVIQMNINESLH